jgi:hypothetical protein
MLHPSLLAAIERPKYIRDADWTHDFLRKSISLDADVIEAAHFSARVQEISSSSSDGTRPLIVLKPQLACDFEKNSGLIEENLRSSSDQRLSGSQTVSTTYQSDSPSCSLRVSPKPLSPYRSSPVSRTSQLRSLRSNTLRNVDEDADSPTKYVEIDETGPLVSSATNALKAIARMQRLLESDRDGVVLRQFW